jgi:colicin import membrane protein
MRRVTLLGQFVIFAALITVAVGCSQKEEAKHRAESEVIVPIEEKKEPAGDLAGTATTPDAKSVVDNEAVAKKDRFDATLLDALNLIAEHKLAAALLKMRDAKDVLDTKEIQQEIDKLQKRIDQQEAAQTTTQAIQTVLASGNPEDATNLATAGLQQFGGGDNADELAKLKRQADALNSASAKDPLEHRKQLLAEAKSALDDNNLRAAAIAYEEALQLQDDADLRKQLDGLHTSLAKYDDNLARARELRKDSANLEDALAALKGAQDAWDTLQIRQEIDNYTLAIQKRRDRLSVADFEVWGDVGLPAPGKRFAEELLPAFKSRFDLVEREQIVKIVDELKLQQSDLADTDKGRLEVGRLAKVRFLVLGSISSNAGLTMNARLVDAQTGLVVQTAKLAAATPEDLIGKLPELANLLMMNDEQKLAREQELAKAAPAVEVKPVAVAALPPAPVAPAVNDKPPAPVVMFNPAPPALGGVQIGDFNQFQPPPAGVVAPPAFAVVDPVRQRLFFLAIELGDNLFRRGRFRESQFQYTLALNLIPNSPDVLLRLDNLAPFLPPGSIINPLIPVGPALGGSMALFNFAAIGDPVFERSGFGSWVADNLAPYFSPPFLVVDRGTVNFYMARLGLTLRDVLRDPFTRQWLGRAMNVRYFLFGTVVQGPRAFNRTLEVKTHLIDVEFGFEVGSGDIITLSPAEMRMRFAELAQLTLLPADQRVIFAQENQAARQLLLDAQVNLGNGQFDIAIDLFRRFRQRLPNNVEAAVLLQLANQQAQAAAFDAGRRQQMLQDQLLLNQAQQQQMALAQQAEAQRIAAAQQAVALGNANQQVRQGQRDRAYERLLAQAQAAQKQNNVNVTVQILESAVALKPNEDGFRQLALARAQADKVERRKLEDIKVSLELSKLPARDKSSTPQIQDLEDTVKSTLARNQLLQAQQERDQAAYQQFVDNAKNFVTKQQFDQAISALQTAQQLRQTNEVKTLLASALAAQTQANLATKDATERAKLEQQLKAEKERREKAEAEAKRNTDLYTLALKLAQDALAQQKFDQAITKFQDAGKIYQTDVVLTGLKSAQDGKAKQQELATAAIRKPVEERKREDDFKAAMTQGQSALDAKQFDKATTAFKQATTLKPDNVDALAALAKAQQAQSDAAAKAAQAEAQTKLQADAKKAFDSLIKSGRDLLASKQYDAAIKAFNDAGKLMPNDATTPGLIDQARKAKADAATLASDAATKQKLQRMLSDARSAAAAGKFDLADKALADAKKFAPDDPTVAQATKDLNDARTTAATEAGNKEKAKQLLADAQAALKAGQLDAADKAIADARKLTPQDPSLPQTAKAVDQARALAAKETDQKAKLDAYKKAMDAGRQAMTAKKYDDAKSAFVEAGKQMPGDKDAAAMLALATSKAKEMTDEATTKKQIQKYLGDFQSALKAGQLDQAGKALVDAKKLAPDDPAVIQGAKDLESARAMIAKETLQKQKMADYQKALAAGRDALAAKKYDEAIKDFTQAGTLMPGDKDAAALLKQAEKAKADAKATTDLDAKKKAEFTRLMDQAQKLVNAKRYSDAVAAYQDALDLMPDNAVAKAGLQKAKKASETVKPASNILPAEYTRQMQLGATLDKQQRYAEAVKAYAAALKAVPNDAKASSAQSFSQHMADGIKLLSTRKYADAAKEFDEALKINADDATAKALAKRAKDGR